MTTFLCTVCLDYYLGDPRNGAEDRSLRRGAGVFYHLTKNVLPSELNTSARLVLLRHYVYHSVVSLHFSRLL
jgi:hypothetical protein